jgi:hypothetical protein
VQDLVCPGAADPGNDALVAQERVQPPRLGRQDLAEPLFAEAERLWPRWASSASAASGVSSQTPARFFGPPSVSTSSPPPWKRRRKAAVFGLFSPVSR